MAARPIWSGVVSFGLLNIPVSLMSGERRTDLHFRMLDCRDKAPVRYERINAETGEEVPWSNVCKAYEYEKGNLVVLEKEDLDAAAPKGSETVEIEGFVELASIEPVYYEKPYILVPGKKADKGYVLLRETLAKTGKAGIARMVVRTREYLCALLPRGDALVVMLLRYAQELVDPDEYRLPSGKSSDYRVSAREVEMAASLIDSMTVAWEPEQYRDEFRKRVRSAIDKRLKRKGTTTKKKPDEAPEAEDAATNVVDFMALLRESLATNKRTPARKQSVSRKRAAPAKKTSVTTASKAVAKKAKTASARKTPAKRAASRTRKAG